MFNSDNQKTYGLRLAKVITRKDDPSPFDIEVAPLLLRSILNKKKKGFMESLGSAIIFTETRPDIEVIDDNHGEGRGRLKSIMELHTGAVVDTLYTYRRHVVEDMRIKMGIATHNFSTSDDIRNGRIRADQDVSVLYIYGMPMRGIAALERAGIHKMEDISRQRIYEVSNVNDIGKILMLRLTAVLGMLGITYREDQLSFQFKSKVPDGESLQM